MSSKAAAVPPPPLPTTVSIPVPHNKVLSMSGLPRRSPWHSARTTAGSFPLVRLRNRAILCITPLSSKSEQKKQAVSMFTPMTQKLAGRRPYFFLLGGLGFSRPTYGLENDSAWRHTP